MKRASALFLVFCLSSLLWAEQDSTYTGPRNAVKTTFLSWFTGSSKLSYEHAWPRIHQTTELTGSLIMAGYDKYKNNPKGYTVRIAQKFFLAPCKKYGHGGYWTPLTGFYFRPELMYVNYRYDNKITHARERSEMGCLIGALGFQSCWGHFIADAYFGSGYCWGEVADTGYEHGFSVWDYFGHRNDHLAMSFSLKVGYAW